MKEFELYIDKKVTEWERTYVLVKAETQEEAIQKCLNEDYEVDSTETLYYTQELVEPTNEPTFEIYDEKHAFPIYTNYPE